MKLHRMALLGLLVCAGTFANAALLFDRGLPEDNLNNAAGANRSNVAWAEVWNVGDTETYMDGDTYTLAGTGLYNVTKIRVWIVNDDTVPFGGYPMTLWGTPAAQGLAGLTQISSTYTATAVTYVNGQTYQGYSGAYRTLWQLDFTTNLIVQGGQTQLFFLQGVRPYTNGKEITPFLHASNKDLSGRPMPGADDKLYYVTFTNGVATGLDTWDSNGYGWDKSSDYNVQVFGEAVVPGPAAALPFLLGLAAAARRRRK